MLEGFLHWLGLGLCHQLPERSYAFSGIQAPVCVRDTGIYVGFMLSLLVVALLHRGERPSGFPKLHVWIAMGLLVAFMGWDGVSSYAGLRQTTNDLRLITGLGAGFAAAVAVLPMLNDSLWTRASRVPVLEPGWRFMAWLAALPATYALIKLTAPMLGIAFLVLVAVCILATLTSINLVLVAMLPWFDRAASRAVGLLAPIGVGLILAIIEVAIAAQLRLWLLGAAASLS